MKYVLFIILSLLIKGELEIYDNYEELVNEKVSEEYCNNVISNLATVIDELYFIQISLRLQSNQKDMKIIFLLLI